MQTQRISASKFDTMLNFDGDANAENGLNVYVAIATQALTSSVNRPELKATKGTRK